ncbi:two-component system, OmpR family, KDP operon response regulator KdpE/two-component system, OmpR family, response regulator RpaB [Porphyromonadaceae bacterium KH3CP3RA]|nr:two-component system, OmpR family, KDP operon response regulator KdpE/two-component system, OmpR family, response regulator RpaB [Porphyromonadaceae bacterium KH3CP3RA]
MNMEKHKIKVLLVDDDILLGNAIARELNERGYDITFLNSVYGVDEAIHRISPDVLVFDVEIGKENGIVLAYDLYAGNPSLPILFISSHHEEKFKEESLLFAGAVAYLDKPFSVKLLAAHIDRFTREKIGIASASNKLLQKVGNALLDLKNKALLTASGNIKELRPMEFNILKKLVAHFADFVSREDIFYAAWEGQSDYYNDQSLNNYIRRLRILLEENTNLEIHTSRGMGYKLNEK